MHREMWVVELVDPPGAFLCRKLDASPSHDELLRHIADSISRIPTKGPWDGSQGAPDDKILRKAFEAHSENMQTHRWMVFCCPQESLARAFVDSLVLAVGDASLPLHEGALDRIIEVFREMSDLGSFGLER